MLFQMINALHREVNELKQKIASGAAVSTVPMESHVPVSPVTQVSPAVTVVPAASPSVMSVVSPDQSRHSQPDVTPYAEEYVEESLSIEDQEKRLIIKALEKNRGRRKKAADELHISERTLYRKIKEYGLEEI
jgi:DNA-binding NtrC family response regulator